MRESARETTIQRHSKIRRALDERVDMNRKHDIRDPVRSACKDLADVLGYSERTLLNIYYDYYT